MTRARLILLGSLSTMALMATASPGAFAAGPFWHVSGAKLTQGAKSIKMQNKGRVGFGWAFAGENIIILCNNSVFNGTIDGQGSVKQGQGKGIFKYEQCEEALKPTCIVTVTGMQLKLHLAIGEVQTKERIVGLFEPSPNPQLEVPLFAVIKLASCGPATGVWPIKGSAATSLAPQEAESQELLLSFTEGPLRVKHEGQEVAVGLSTGTVSVARTGAYGARLQPSAPFGVFLT